MEERVKALEEAIKRLDKEIRELEAEISALKRRTLEPAVGFFGDTDKTVPTW